MVIPTSTQTVIRLAASAAWTDSDVIGIFAAAAFVAGALISVFLWSSDRRVITLDLGPVDHPTPEA